MHPGLILALRISLRATYPPPESQPPAMYFTRVVEARSATPAHGASACTTPKSPSSPVGGMPPARPGWIWATVLACVVQAMHRERQKVGNYPPAAKGS